MKDDQARVLLAKALGQLEIFGAEYPSAQKLAAEIEKFLGFKPGAVRAVTVLSAGYPTLELPTEIGS